MALATGELQSGSAVTANLDLFAYLAAFVTVVLALGLTDMLRSLHRLVRDRERVRWSITALLAVAVVFQAILGEFFALWRLAGVERFTYYDLLALISSPIVLSLAAMGVLPDSVPSRGLDLGDRYMSQRRVLFFLLSLWVVAILIRWTGLFDVMPNPVPRPSRAAAAQIPILLALFTLLAWSRRRGIQVIGLLLILLLMNSVMSRQSVEIPRDRLIQQPPAPSP